MKTTTTKELTTPSKLRKHSFWKTGRRTDTDLCTSTLETNVAVEPSIFLS